MKSSYLDYAMSVIVSRALPDVRDGLKPVHRRILYACQEAGYVAGRPYRKCSRIVGDVMGKYHPHGDSAIYFALAVWPRIGRCWSCSSMARAISDQWTRTTPQRCGIPKRGSPRFPTACLKISTRKIGRATV